MAKKPNPRPNENGGQHNKGGRVPLLDSIKFSLICERYAETGASYASCEELGFNYNTVMNAIKAQVQNGDDSWQDLWDESYAKFKESLERAVFKRGRDGTPTKWRIDPNTNERIAIEWEYSDRLLELAVKGHFPERYRERIHHSGTVGLEPVDAFANLTPQAKREIRAIVMRDLEEQRKAHQDKIVEGEYSEVGPDALADLRAAGEDD